MRQVFQEKPWWLAAVVASTLGVICYWSDWVRLFGLHEVVSGDLIRNTGKALIASVVLGIIFRNQRIAACLALVGPAFIVRQFTIARDSPPGSNLRDFVLMSDVVFVVVIVIVLLLAAASNWFTRKRTKKTDGNPVPIE